MRITTVVFLAVFLFSGSCGQKNKSSEEAIEFYNSVSEQITSGRQDQQNFIDKLSYLLETLKANKDAVIDTKELDSLFQAAWSQNLKRQRELQEIIEYDHDIEYKNATMQYFQSFSRLYDDEMPNIISIFGEKSEDRLERIVKLLEPYVVITEQMELLMRQTQEEFKSKYDDALNYKATITKGDYEYLKLNDFKFELTDIEDGTAIELLSFSGGKFDKNEDKIYYKQFIGINTSNGDTVRILAWATRQIYDFKKAKRIGIFKNIRPDVNESPASEKEFIIFNMNQAGIEFGNYKTAFGLLEFK